MSEKQAFDSPRLIWQVPSDSLGIIGRVRARRTVEEKCRIVELTLEPGASVSRVAQAGGVSANQVFLWRPAYWNECRKISQQERPVG